MKKTALKLIALALPLVLGVLYLMTADTLLFNTGRTKAPTTDMVIALQMRATIFLVLAIISLCFAYYVCVIKSSISEGIKNSLLLVTVLLVLALCGECFFLHDESSNTLGARWSYRLWDRKYITHRTSFDYIDSKGQKQRAYFRESINDTTTDKKHIWFIGDSFTFGFGLEQTAQTFPALVGQQLNERVACINLGNGGADTYQERDILFAYDSATHNQPSVVVWQYFGNDIDGAEDGLNLYEKKMDQRTGVSFGRRFFEGKSFLLDYIYWEYFQRNETGLYNTYTDFLSRTYLADSIVKGGIALRDSASAYITPYHEHLKPLKEAANYYKSKGIRFVVIIFPYLWDKGPESAEQLYATRLSTELKADGTDAIDLTPMIKSIPTDKRMVNSHDLHPSVLVDRMVADTISKYLVLKYGI